MQVKKLLTMLLSILLLTVFLCGCLQKEEDVAQAQLSDYPQFVEVPLIRQGTTYSCGIAAMHSLLRWASYDWDINDEYLMEDCGTTRENGTTYQSILAYIQKTGELEVTWQEEMTAEELKKVINNGGVVMMPLQAWEYKETSPDEWVSFDAEDYRDYWASGHWVIACGYNDSGVLFMDPGTAGCYTAMTWADMEIRWHDSPDYIDDNTPFIKYEHCGMVVYKTGTEEYDRQVVQPLG